VLKVDMLVYYASPDAEDCAKSVPVKYKMADGAQIGHIQIAVTTPSIVRF